MSVAVCPFALFGALIEAPRPAKARALRDDGTRLPLHLDRWLGPNTAADEAVADAAVGPVLDVGCGPGRLLDALSARGKWALGVDLSPIAVRHARRHGRRAVLADVFKDIPGTGDWRTAVLLDGNIGIGGDPAALLVRLAGLLAEGGQIITELEGPGAPAHAGRIRLEAGETTSHWFPWAHLGVDGVETVADTADLGVQDVAVIDGRWFAWLG